MERRYKSLYLTDEWDKIQSAMETGEHVVPCLPLVKGPADADLSHFSYVLEDAESVEEEYLDRIDARLSGKPIEILRTKRCVVREITLSDVDSLYEIYADPRITRYMENLYADPDEERAYTRDYIKWHYDLLGFGMWIVEDRQGRIIGRAGFDQKEEGVIELGFMIRADEQRKGYAYEVCSALLFYGYSTYGWKGMKSRCHRDNEASIGLLKKLGFVPLREEDNHIVWFT
ncbi:MAG: GNAT family N-acetyltransferase [Lachnospiraceae bacterium]|nr:GNAT family N-acetyltransferase [Lachnospiraceae bacterium]